VEISLNTETEMCHESAGPARSTIFPSSAWVRICGAFCSGSLGGQVRWVRYRCTVRSAKATAACRTMAGNSEKWPRCAGYGWMSALPLGWHQGWGATARGQGMRAEES